MTFSAILLFTATGTIALMGVVFLFEAVLLARSKFVEREATRPQSSQTNTLLSRAALASLVGNRQALR